MTFADTTQGFAELEQQAHALKAAISIQAEGIEMLIEPVLVHAAKSNNHTLHGWANDTVRAMTAIVTQYRNGHADVAFVLESLRDAAHTAGSLTAQMEREQGV